jgi:hypothetical protein
LGVRRLESRNIIMADLKPGRGSSEELELELYKSLRTELAGYVEKVPGLWLQKFVLVGAVIAFLVTNHDKLKGSGNLLIASVLSIPVLSVLLDAKIVEYGLHARAISMFIANNFSQSPVVAAWEATLWGDKGREDVVSLVRLRSITTVVVTAIPTIILMLISGLAVDEIRSPRSNAFIYGAAIVSIVYALVTVYAWQRVWPERRNNLDSAPNSSAAPDANHALRGRRR